MSSQHLFLTVTLNGRYLELINKFLEREEYWVINPNHLYTLNQALSKSKYIFYLALVNIWSWLRISGVNAIASGRKQIIFVLI